MNKPTGRYVMAAWAAACVLTPLPGHAQQDGPNWPNKAIRCIIPTAPGGGSDQIVRLLGQRFTQAWGQQVVVDHRPGAGQTIGIDLVAKATPDGHTIAVDNPSHAINATLMAKLPYDPVRDLAVVTIMATQPYAMVFTPSFAPKSVKELIAAAKARPRELVFVSSGPGSASHLAAEMFVAMAGIEMTHIPYRGIGAAYPDILGGQVQCVFASSISAMPFLQTQRLRAIATTGAQRAKVLPDLPTIVESGVSGFVVTQWYGLLAPAGTPRAIVAKLHTAVAAILRAPDIKERLARDGAEVVGNTPDEFARVQRDEIAKYVRLVAASGMQKE